MPPAAVMWGGQHVQGSGSRCACLLQPGALQDLGTHSRPMDILIFNFCLHPVLPRSMPCSALGMKMVAKIDQYMILYKVTYRYIYRYGAGPGAGSPSALRSPRQSILDSLARANLPSKAVEAARLEMSCGRYALFFIPFYLIFLDNSAQLGDVLQPIRPLFSYLII